MHIPLLCRLRLLVSFNVDSGKYRACREHTRNTAGGSSSFSPSIAVFLKAFLIKQQTLTEF
jgi:hypothetical protein